MLTATSITMRGLIACCLVALAACQSVRYDLNLNPKKSYLYKYEGLVNFGLGMPNLAESGVRMSCNLKIVGVSPQTFILQLSDLAFEEFNGFPGKNTFNASPKLSQRIAAQLIKPFMFDYAGGHVTDIRAPAEASDTVVNIVRGILDFFQVTVKTTQRVYQLEELGIHGKCQSNYATEENTETKDMTITQVIDVDNCVEKAAIYRGMATAVLDKVAKQRGESIISTVRYVYTVKPTAEGGIITRACGLERQHFSPFNVKGGSFKMQATKELVLVGESDAAAALSAAPMESRGNIVFKFVEEGADVPLLMQDLQNPLHKAIELIKQLAEANRYHIDSASTEDTIKVYQLLRVMPYEGLEEMWKQFASEPEYRRWFLDMIVEVTDARILRFLAARFQIGDITTNEAYQTYLLSMNHLRPVPELVEMAKMFLKMPFSRSGEYLWHVVVLGYGSLVYKHCAYYTPCPVTAVQPLLEMAMEGLRSKNVDDMVLALKALGNAGHPSSIKTIMRFLPGVAATPVDLPPRVLSAAVQSMRLIAARDPHSVQDITMSLFLEKGLPVEVRMLSFVVLFESKPSLALVSTVTSHLLEEKDLHVASFAYSYLRSLARSSTADNHFLSTACSVAVKMLSPKFGRLSYHFSKAIRMDWFDDDFLIGTSTEVFMLRSATNIFPSEFLMKGKFYFIGRILQLIELGIRAETIKELFGTHIPGFRGDLSFSDFQALFAVLQNWRTLPDDKPLLTAFTRASGQEWFFADLHKQFIADVINAFSPSAGKDSPFWEAFENLQTGFSWHKTKPFLVFEVRYFQATTLGLPLEISKYYEVLNGITVNAKGAVTPPMTSHLGQILNSEISLESDGFVGFTKDFWVFYGINTELFQSGTEFKSKMPVAVPWKFAAKINFSQKKFELDLPPFKNEIEVFAVRSNVYAVSRNIEDLASAKMTPIMPDLVNEVVDKVPESPEMETPNKWHPKAKVCAESNIYGAGLCVESELRREYYHEEYPLYYFLGYTNIAVKLVPVPTATAVDKIHFEFNAGAGRNPMGTQEVLAALRMISKKAMEHLGSESTSGEIGSHRSGEIKNLLSTPESLFTFKALAVNSMQKPEGFDAAVYYTPEGDAQNAQLIVSEVGEDTNWKMCIDTTVEGRVEAKAHVRWGAECQSYEMSIRASTAHLPGSMPTLKAKVHWAKIPEAMVEIGHRVETYIPGMAFLLGFYQQNERNNRQEIAATLVAASEDSVDVKLQFPEYTVYRQAIPVLLPPVTFEEDRIAARNTTIRNH
ncbi:vitellogenin 3, phosvitinless [Synchiropus splendidus]|uniref:vitellogenin 3, phosvitinless n=1 Tax=Synchiropus splendidus TaxID=270530 RepID=UPI00237EDAF6|nr:vitellogenin 3, phosvitinless [Synchiropus splendidus]XP_053723149.1 vitellogenin 3, phosvitinless [Synchiropus splendidus]XP_053723159.1 vitellogenin 3, phosvitinless [Synchiropus splendidus]